MPQDTGYEHLPEQLARIGKPVTAATRFGTVTGGTAPNGAAVFLEVPFALSTPRFTDAQPLPADYRYPSTPFVYEKLYAAQPMNDGQAAGVDPEDKLGRGEPTEDPFFVNIVAPPGFDQHLGSLSVKVYIHGGFLQFGSPHGIGSQSQHVAIDRHEVWVNIGYRLSVFGFLASQDPPLAGNFGFKDQWLALLWIKNNIAAFGGDPTDVQILGLSAGAHSCHQLLHHASRLPLGVKAPFHSAILMSNALLLNPKTPQELQAQYLALLGALAIEPSPDALEQLSDPTRTPAQRILDDIDAEALGPGMSTFRGTSDGKWMHPGAMEWQRGGGFAAGLKAHGVNLVVLGDLSEEWYLYSIAHPIATPQDVSKELARYYPEDMVGRLVEQYPVLPNDATPEECAKHFGEILSDGQVYVPVRLLARDLQASGFPFVRYHIKWTPPALRPRGLVTHGTDAAMWRLRPDMLTRHELDIAKNWWQAVDVASREALLQTREPDQALTLHPDQSISWAADGRWSRFLELAEHLKI